MKDFLKSFLSFGFATSIEKILSLLLLPLYTRSFGADNYGVMDLIQILITFVSVFCLLQLETSLQRYYYKSENQNDKKILVSSITYVVAGLSLLLSALVILFSKNISELLFHTPIHFTTITIASLQIPLVNFSILMLIILRFEKQNKKFLISILSKILVTIISTYLLIVILNKGIISVFYSALFANLISCIYLFIINRKYFTLKLNKDKIKESFNYALPQFPARLGSASISYVNRFFMVAFVSLTAIGIYSVSLKLASSVQLLYTAFSMAWTPFMFQQFEKDNHKLIFSNVLNILVYVLFGIIVLITLFANEIIMIVADKDFYEARFYLGGLALFFVFYIFKEVVDIGPKKMEKTKYLSFNFFISVIVNLISLYFFTKFLGIRGVVYSMLITNISLFYISWFVSNKLYYIDYKITNFTIHLIITLLFVVYMMYFDINLWIKIIVALFILIYSIMNAKKQIEILNKQKI